jgi:WD40 repeat protein/tRNA A-37 threonylcarbamoyl transferase component Bud32
MSYCLHPGCPKPENPDDVHSCQSCGLPLLLKERYRAIEPIDQGGFGKTFLAVDEDMPSKRQCVIKQFFNQSGLKAQKAKELFVQEAVQLEKLGKQHPQIPELFAHVELGTGLFLVQEFIDGQNLLQELKQEGAFDEAKIRQLLNDLLPVLQFIHSQQVIHRDIKPDNIIRRQVDGKLILVDFGASKFATETALERTGTVIGTPGYAAPEQSEGKIYFSSDLFSLGRTCFHLLTHTEPKKVFSQYGDWEKYLRINLNKSSIGDTLRRVLTKLLQPDISQRYQSAEEVLQDLNLAPTQVTVESPLTFSTFALKPPTQSWRCIHTLTQHSSTVLSVAISPNSQILASGSGVNDMTIKIWDLTTAKLLRTLPGHSSGIMLIAFCPEEQTLVSVSSDKTIKIWNLGRSRLLRTFIDPDDSSSLWSAAVSPDGETLAMGYSGKIKLWNLYTGEIYRLLLNEEQYSDGFSLELITSSVAISPDGQIVAAGSSDGKIKGWYIDDGELACIFSMGNSEIVNTVAFSPDGNILVGSNRQESIIKLWHPISGELLYTFTGHSKSVDAVAFSPDSQTLATGGYDCAIKLWHLDTGKEICTLTGHSEAVLSLIFSSDGKTLVSGSIDKTIKIWQRE